jgi:oligopeptide/dipeptide ABC transporter ATP-binding protein
MYKILQVNNLRISFRTIGGKLQAVRDVSFHLNKGETLAIVGESGSGKSVTCKGILGILAGNAIIEGGEMLYDGQDLLKIEEEDFHKLRGDKIAMIFQDPLSSLNPIMRIGKQLTEAMLLKGKARQASSKRNFDEKTALLEKYMLESDPMNADESKRMMNDYKQMIMKFINRERSYAKARDAVSGTREEIEDLLFYIEKNALKKPKEQLKELRRLVHDAKDVFVISDKENHLITLADSLAEGLGNQERAKDFTPLKEKLLQLRQGVADIINKPVPDLLPMAYYSYRNNDRELTGTVEENNIKYIDYYESEFARKFLEKVEKALDYSDKKHVQLRENAIQALRGGVETIQNGGVEAFKPVAAGIYEKVDASIEPIMVVKDSAAWTFSGAIKGFLKMYDDGLKNNEKRVNAFQRKQEKHDRLIAQGKDPGWKVIPPAVVDMDRVRADIQQQMVNLADKYQAMNIQEPHENKHQKAVQLLAYLNENAAGIVNKVTQYAAKAKAIKLMEEVGIPEPRQRYRQYPFEFSGGMRQRIVIAIALAADPDILICDEPTTALDVTIQAQILELINKLKKERNLSIIFITHDLGVVANMADRIAVMYAGKIVEQGTAQEVFYEPAHPYTWALLSSMPDLDTKEKLEAIPGTPPNMIYPPKGDAFADRNRYAMEIDFEMEPPMFDLSPTHSAATWLLHPDAPKANPPAVVVERIRKMKARAEVNSHE